MEMPSGVPQPTDSVGARLSVFPAELEPHGNPHLHLRRSPPSVDKGREGQESARGMLYGFMSGFSRGKGDVAGGGMAQPHGATSEVEAVGLGHCAPNPPPLAALWVGRLTCLSSTQSGIFGEHDKTGHRLLLG